MARKAKLTLVASKTPQLRKAAKRDWSKAKAAKFLAVLGETCNVSEACRRSGVPMTVAYRRRRMDAAFRAAWLEAIGAAYQRLELVLLDRAFNGTEKVIKRRDGSEERMLEYSNQLGLTLLKMHRETAIEADSDMPAEDVDEIRERLVKKLQRLKKRNEEQEAERAGYGVMRHEMNMLANATEEQQREIIKNATLEQMLALDTDFEQWAHRNQLPPNGEGWRVWLMMAGRGFGKTRAGAEWIFRLANARPGVRVALIGASIGDARSIMIEGVSGLLSVSRRFRRRLRWEPSLGRLKWPNGSEAQLFSGDHADGLRGPEHDFAWADELAKWRQAEDAWINLQFGLRRGPRPRALVTTTPRPMELLKRMMDDKRTITTRGRTSDNINLDPGTIELLTETYGGTRIGRQELDGELLADVEGALWPWELIERCRTPAEFVQDGRMFDRIVVGVDPPAGPSTSSGRAHRGDACGIIVAASAGETLYVLEDASVQGLSPEGWTNRVAAAAARWNATLVVAEANNGGAMVKSVLSAADTGLKVRLVHASIGKSARAEPIALKFERGKAWLAGTFPELEAELAGLQAGGGYEGPGRSPDRADAMVWAMTVLSETKSGVPRVRRL